MNYEEKKELRLQISQMLADAGINQTTLKQMAEDMISKKVDRAIDQVMLNIFSEEKMPLDEYVFKRISGGGYLERAVNHAIISLLYGKNVEITIHGGEKK